MKIRNLTCRNAALMLCCAFAWLSSFAKEIDPTGLTIEDGLYVTSAEYLGQFTFEWTDASGRKHTNSVLDRATDPAHIAALITEVYTNPNIPGYTEDMAVTLPGAEAYKPTNPGEHIVPYRPCTEPPYNMPADMVIERPLPGATALLVELKNSFPSWDGTGQRPASPSTAEESFSHIRAVTVIPNQMHIGPSEGSTNPGFIFNLEVAFNKGFIMTKGSIRRVYNHDNTINENHLGTQPFYNMFEEFSPTNEHTLYNVYREMRGGSRFAVDHNCSSVMAQSHDMVMTAKGVNRDQAINLRFFLPDLRFAGKTTSNWADENAPEYQHYTYYAQGHQPYMFYNYINANVTGFELTGDENQQALVGVSWESHAKEITRSNMPEEFYVYRVYNDVVESTPVPASEIVIEQDGTSIEEDGRVVRSLSSDVSVKVLEPLTVAARKVTYVITGRPVGSDFSFVDSNQTDGHLPGMNTEEVLELNISGSALASFDIPNLKNDYNNSVVLIANTSEADFDAKPTGTVLKYGTIKGKKVNFYLHRISTNENVYTRIARFYLDDVEGSVTKNSEIVSGSGWGVVKYVAKVEYYDLDGVQEFLNTVPEGASEYIEVKFDTYRKGDEAVALALDNHKGVLGKFTDIFSESTAADLQPAAYEYRIIFSPDDDTQLASNTVPVAIIKRNLYAGYDAYTADEIANDVNFDTRLAASHVGLAVDTRSNANISGYSIFNVDNPNDPQLVAFIDRYASGRFEIYVPDEDGNVEDHSYNRPTANGYSGKVTIHMPRGMKPGSRYVLRAEYINGNSYGNAVVTMPEITTPEFVAMQMQYESQNEADQKHNYSCNVSWDRFDSYAYYPRPDVTDDDNQHYVNPVGEALWCSVPESYMTEAEGDFTLVHHGVNENAVPDYNPAQPVKASARTSSPDASFNFVHEHAASPETPVTTGHYLRRYTELPARANISRSTEGGIAVADNYVTVSITSTDKNPEMSGVEDIDADLDNSQYNLFDLQGRPVNSATAPAGIYFRVSQHGVEKVVIR